MVSRRDGQFFRRLEAVFLIVCAVIALALVALGKDMNTPVNWRNPSAWVGLVAAGMLPLGYLLLSVHGGVTRYLDRRFCRQKPMEIYSIVSVAVFGVGFGIEVILAPITLLLRMAGLLSLPLLLFLRGYTVALCLGLFVALLAKRAYMAFIQR